MCLYKSTAGPNTFSIFNFHAGSLLPDILLFFVVVFIFIFAVVVFSMITCLLTYLLNAIWYQERTYTFNNGKVFSGLYAQDSWIDILVDDDVRGEILFIGLID